MTEEEKKEMMKTGVRLVDLIAEVKMTNVLLQDLGGYLVLITEQLRRIERNQPDPTDYE